MRLQTCLSTRGNVTCVVEGKSLAKSYGSKYMEVSAILNHKVDDLLVSALKQIRLCSGRGRRRRTDDAAEQGVVAPGGVVTPAEDNCFPDLTPTVPINRSRSPGLLDRLKRVASPRRT